MNRRTFLTTATAGAAALTAALPLASASASTRGRPAPDSAPLRTWFEATYRSMTGMTTQLGLTAVTMDVSGTGTPVPSTQTSPTNIC